MIILREQMFLKGGVSMECPNCNCEMEEYSLKDTKIVYKDNGEETQNCLEKNIYLCPVCKTVIGKAL